MTRAQAERLADVMNHFIADGQTVSYEVVLELLDELGVDEYRTAVVRLTEAVEDHLRHVGLSGAFGYEDIQELASSKNEVKRLTRLNS